MPVRIKEETNLFAKLFFKYEISHCLPTQMFLCQKGETASEGEIFL